MRYIAPQDIYALFTFKPRYLYHIVLILALCGVVFAQFHTLSSYRFDIEMSNHYLLIVTSVALSLLTMPLLFFKRVKYGLGDLVAGLFAVYIILNATYFGSAESVDFTLSLSYISLFYSLRTIILYDTIFVKICVSIILIAGISQAILSIKQLLGIEYSNHFRFAVTGSFYNPGPCGIFLCGVLSLAVAELKNSKIKLVLSKEYKEYLSVNVLNYLLAHIAFVVLVVVIIPTMSRAGWIGVAVAILFLYRDGIVGIIKNTSKMVKLPFKVTSMLLVVMCLVTILGVYLLKQDSADGRVFIWRNALTAFSDNPIFGVGVGNFAESYSGAQRDFFIDNNALTEHNSNSEVAGVIYSAFNEIVALVMLLGVVGAMFVAYIFYQKFRDRTVLNSSMFYMGISVFISSLFSYSFYVPAISLLFIFALASFKEIKVMSCVWQLLVKLFIVLLIVYNIFHYFEFEKDMKAYKEWKEVSLFYSMDDYSTVVEEYEKLLPQ